MQSQKIAVIIGAGEGLGASIAKEFASHKYTTIVCRRNKDSLKSLIQEIEAMGQKSYGYSVDASNEQQVQQMVEDVEKNHGPIEVGVFNASGFVMKPALETSIQEYQQQWNLNAFGGIIFGNTLARKMVERKHGSLLFTGATASLRGGNGFSAFASSKAALRNYTMSLAKELGPQGVHVGHIIIDGAIDSAETRKWMGSKLKKDVPIEDQMLQPDSIAKNYWFLHQQPKNSWTYELDVRPSYENW